MLPITFWTFLVGSLTLAGFPLLSGFWSKDEILAALHDRAHHASDIGLTVQAGLYNGLYWLAIFVAFLTAFYTFRAFFMTFYGKTRIPPEAGDHAHESPASMTVPLVILAICSVVVGGYLAWTHAFAEFLSRTPSLAFAPVAATAVEPEFHTDIMLISSLVALAGIALAAVMYLGGRSAAESLARALRPLYTLSHRKFYFDEIYSALVVWPLRMFAYVCYAIDRFIIDGLVNLFGWIPALFGYLLRSLQNGMVQFYALAMVLGLLVLMASLVMRS